MTQIDVGQPRLVIISRNSAEALCTLVQNCKTAFLHTLIVSASIEAAGWAALTKALSSASVTVQRLFASRELAKEGKREDLRAIWEALSEEHGGWYFDDMAEVGVHKSWGEEGWEALKQVLDQEQIQD